MMEQVYKLSDLLVDSEHNNDLNNNDLNDLNNNVKKLSTKYYNHRN